MEHPVGTLLSPAGEQHIPRPRHFCAGGCVAFEILADSELWRGDHRFCSLCYSQAKGFRKHGERNGPAPDKFWHPDYHPASGDVPALVAPDAKFTIRVGNA